MANEIRMSSSVTAVKEVDVTEGGNTYDLSAVDTNAGKNFGGHYNTLTAYGDGAIARWSSVVVSATSADGLDNSVWTEASDVTDGTLPTTAYAVAVEYISELGTVGNVKVTIGSQEMADLDAGEGVALPLSGGVAIANVKIHADAYSNGTNEATVNVLVLGT